ncbi:hypothetical protein [uncultured Treponema sp.]|uniref:hypothetical protein n=1 Tax=uncultured Treponema sp. TaxID=162155 RepID=UPI0025F42BB4|nr:hypothetical protein [uncultured Treponema sp.]
MSIFFILPPLLLKQYACQVLIIEKKQDFQQNPTKIQQNPTKIQQKSNKNQQKPTKTNKNQQNPTKSNKIQQKKLPDEWTAF